MDQTDYLIDVEEKYLAVDEWEGQEPNVERWDTLSSELTDYCSEVDYYFSDERTSAWKGRGASPRSDDEDVPSPSGDEAAAHTLCSLSQTNASVRKRAVSKAPVIPAAKRPRAASRPLFELQNGVQQGEEDYGTSVGGIAYANKAARWESARQERRTHEEGERGLSSVWGLGDRELGNHRGALSARSCKCERPSMAVTRLPCGSSMFCPFSVAQH